MLSPEKFELEKEERKVWRETKEAIFAIFGGRPSRKKPGTTSCSNLLIECVFKYFGGELTDRGELSKEGKVGDKSLQDVEFGNVGKKISAGKGIDALVNRGMAQEVDLQDLRTGDVLRSTGHVSFYVAEAGKSKGGRRKVWVLQANVKTGSDAPKLSRVSFNKNWPAARLITKE